jgi:glutaminase
MGPLDNDGASYVSTGELPSPEQVRRSLHDAYQRFRTETAGERSQVYPALAHVPAQLFGICAAGARGGLFGVGDADIGFTIMSVAKPFVFAMVCATIGPEQIRQRLGVNATGLPFNSLAAVERSPDGRTNPMVNPGAIATASLAPGDSVEAKWVFLQDGLSRVTATDLAVMGATLANGGVNPRTKDQVVQASVCHYTLAVMATAGLYETSGEWLYEVGVPGKSGIGGGIVVVSPGKGALATFAPPLDGFGNSVKGQLAARFLSHRLGLTLFASEPT